MRRALRFAPWLAPLVAAAAAAMLVALAAAQSGGRHRAAPARAPVWAEATLTPRVSLFGAAIRADVRVAVNTKRVDPRTVRVAMHFAPFSLAARPRTRIERLRGTTVVRFVYRIQCLTAACSQPGTQALVRFRPAVVSWGKPARRSLVAWPRATVASRLTRGDVVHPSLRYLTTTPARRYRVDPVVLGWTAVAAAAALVVALGVVVPLVLRRRGAAAEPPSSELEQALARVERAAWARQADRRAAIGELAQALERDGFAELAPLARRLAWSSGGPSAAVASELALLVRAALEVAA